MLEIRGSEEKRGVGLGDVALEVEEEIRLDEDIYGEDDEVGRESRGRGGGAEVGQY